jgi:hypothetical protein
LWAASATTDTVLFAYSAMSARAGVALASIAGFVAFVEKPTDPIHLLEIIERFALWHVIRLSYRRPGNYYQHVHLRSGGLKRMLRHTVWLVAQQISMRWISPIGRRRSPTRS